MKRRQFLKDAAICTTTIASLQQLETLADELEPTETMPALFLGHGSPMNAIEDNKFVAGFRQVASTIAKPRAILCISAHWYTQGTKVTSMELPKTIHDFGGFPKELYEVQYPAPGEVKLAAETQKLLAPAEIALDQSWGLDHGAWSVLVHMYPDADIPVIQLSVDRTQGPQYHYELGKRLAKLRQQGVLIVGSGNLIHNLREIDFQRINQEGYGYDWAQEANAFFTKQLETGEYTPLIQYQKQGKAVARSIPTPDHYLPLLYVLGLPHEPGSLEIFNNQLVGGSIGMLSLKVG